MLTPATSIAIGFAFVLLGGVNVWLVLEAWSQVKASKASARLLALHRVGGYAFIALFCVMTYFMVARLRGGTADGSATVTIHLILAMILSPLLFIKVLIARYYKNQHGLLMPIGLGIFVISFVLIASTAGPYLARVRRTEQVAMDPALGAPVTIDVNQASDLMQRRCSKCHNLDRVVGARKDAEGWSDTVHEMAAMPGAGISDTEMQTIISYLSSQNRPKGSEATVKMEVSRALVDRRCGRCHGLDRVYKEVETPAEWRETVARMVEHAAGSAGALQPGEDERILEYLSATQTPEAVAQRKAQAEAAASSGQSLIARKVPVAASTSAAGSRYDGRAIGFVSVVCLAGLVLVMRRPRAPVASVAVPVAAKAVRPAGGPFLLHLVQITRQSGDSVTLRFAVSGERKLEARAGQFLTFSFLFDGKKETRCYSICSSPARSGYVEITPKRVANGCVSVFLNERAAVGMTVEATGPFGQFYLREDDRKIVLLAAGSGITPMMAMLRYVDDLCLGTEATLLYCVRTAKDILFREELEQLQGRLKGFRYRVLLSQAEGDWAGERGHISREFVSRHVPEVGDGVFFLCGPPPFMDAARGILTGLEVDAERIRQETFGGAGAPKGPVAAASGSGFTVAFSISGKRAMAPAGQTLLETAAGAGVAIPSACRQGQCGTCKTRLVSGEVRMTAEQGLDAESRARGFVLTCVGHAEGDVTLEV